MKDVLDFSFQTLDCCATLLKQAKTEIKKQEKEEKDATENWRKGKEIITLREQLKEKKSTAWTNARPNVSKLDPEVIRFFTNIQVPIPNIVEQGETMTDKRYIKYLKTEYNRILKRLSSSGLEKIEKLEKEIRIQTNTANDLKNKVNIRENKLKRVEIRLERKMRSNARRRGIYLMNKRKREEREEREKREENENGDQDK